ncbi:MAG: MATE family efflux transporter [Gammaproteobacteria bacterium]|nr:MATE family efflux transporter [Gammaproteobacteria bacterium]
MRRLTRTISNGAIRAALAETERLVAIASPLVLSSLASMAISITDVLMMGWLGPLALGSGAVASDLYSIFFYFAAAVVSAATPLISQARGGRSRVEIARIQRQSIWLGAVMGGVMAVPVWYADILLGWLHVQPEVVATGAPYARMMAIALPVFVLDIAWRNFLVAHESTRVLFYVTLSAIPVNALGNYMLMFGNLGAPDMGLAGAGVASIVAGFWMFSVLTVYTLTRPAFRSYRLMRGLWRPRCRGLPEFLRIGVPMGFHSLGEVGAFLLSTVLMGIVGAEAVAAHAAALRVSGVLYAVPLGLSQAATVRVGFGVGARSTITTLYAGRIAFGLATATGLTYLAVVGIYHDAIAGWFITPSVSNAEIFALAGLFLVFVAVMQPFECGAVVVPGILRGFTDTRVPMIYALVCYWGIGIGGGLLLAFPLNRGGVGIWIGLLSGTVVLSLLLTVRFLRRERTIRRGNGSEPGGQDAAADNGLTRARVRE